MIYVPNLCETDARSLLGIRQRYCADGPRNSNFSLPAEEDRVFIPFMMGARESASVTVPNFRAVPGWCPGLVLYFFLGQSPNPLATAGLPAPAALNLPAVGSIHRSLQFRLTARRAHGLLYERVGEQALSLF